jgi:hypothetical protein
MDLIEYYPSINTGSQTSSAALKMADVFSLVERICPQ